MTEAAMVHLSLDIGRGWRARTRGRSARRRLAGLLVELLESSLVPLLESGGHGATAFLGDLAWAQPRLVETLRRSSSLDLGVRLFPGADRALPEDRDEEIAYLAALQRQVTGRRALFFRGEASDVDGELGPSLSRHGLIADFSAHEGSSWPRAPWWSSQDADLSRPGRGRVLEVPLSVDLAIDGRRGVEDPIAFEPFRIAPRDRLITAFEAWGERRPVEGRTDGGAPPLLHVAFELEDLLPPQTRQERFDRLRMLLRLVADEGGLECVTAGVLAGRLARRPPALVPTRVVDDGGRLERLRFAEAGGIVAASGRREAPGWPLDEILEEAGARMSVGEGLWLDLPRAEGGEGPTAEEWRWLAELLAPGRGLRPRGVLADAAGRGLAAVFQKEAGLRGGARVPLEAAAGSERSASLPLSFCIVSNGRRPADVARVLACIRAQEIPDADVMIVGRHEGEVGPGVRIIAAEEEADSGRLGAMRNRAARAARHDHLVVLDDDILLSPGWYRALRARLAGMSAPLDVLTSRVLLPEGGRYWDHCTVGGPRGHQLLEAEEADEFVYMTGGGAWVMSRRVFARVGWCDDRAFYEGEDVDFARRVQAEGFRIDHESAMIAFHDAGKYTTIGRTVSERTLERDAGWVVERLAGRDPEDLATLAEDLLARDRLAEAADVLRVLVRRHPEHHRGRRAWVLMERRRGGPLRGLVFEPEGCPLYRRTRAMAERADRPELAPVPGGGARR